MRTIAQLVVFVAISYTPTLAAALRCRHRVSKSMHLLNQQSFLRLYPEIGTFYKIEVMHDFSNTLIVIRTLGLDSLSNFSCKNSYK